MAARGYCSSWTSLIRFGKSSWIYIQQKSGLIWFDHVSNSIGDFGPLSANSPSFRVSKTYQETPPFVYRLNDINCKCIIFTQVLTTQWWHMVMQHSHATSAVAAEPYMHLLHNKTYKSRESQIAQIKEWKVEKGPWYTTSSTTNYSEHDNSKSRPES